MYTFKNVTKTFKIFISLSLLLFLSSPLFSASPPSKIFVLQTTDHPALNETRKGLLDELKALGYKKGKNFLYEYQSAQGNPALAVQIAQKFVSENADVIVAIGTTAAQAAVTAAKETKTPIVFSSVTDPLGAKLVSNLKAPEGYVTGVSNFIAIEPQFKFFKNLLPNLKTLGIIYNPGEANSVAMVKAMKDAAKAFGLKIVTATALKTSDVLSASQSLCGKADAMFVNNDNTALAAFKSVVKAAQGCEIPAFVSDVDLADQGALGALGPDQKEIGRQTGRLVDKILKNPDTPMPPVEFPQKMEEYIEK